MTPSEWFYAKGEKHFGPVSANELKRLAGTGEILPDDLIWREGMAGWTIARNVGGLFDKTSAPANAGAAGHAPEGPPKIVDPVSVPSATAGTVFSPVAPQVQEAGRPSRHVFDLFLDFVRVQFPASFVESTGKLFVTAGKWGLFTAMGLTLLFSLLLAAKVKNYEVLLGGLISALILAVLQYVGGKFCEVSDRLNRNSNANVSSTAFLDCFALLSIVSGVALLIGSIAIAIPGHTFWWIIAGLAAFVVCEYLAFIALNPSAVYIDIVPESRPGEEAIGLLAFLFKALLRLVPIIFGTYAIGGCLLLIYACVSIYTESGPVAGEMIAGIANTALRFSAALPLVAYLAFLLIYLALDLCRALLVLPGKLDRVREVEEKKENGEK